MANSKEKSLQRNNTGTAGTMPLPLILAPLEQDASMNKKRSLSSYIPQPGSPTEGAPRGVAPAAVQSVPVPTEAMSATPSLLLGKQGKRVLRRNKSVSDGCDAPEVPPIVICGRDMHFDEKSHGNQLLLKLIRLNLIPYREADDEIRAVLVRKIVAQITWEWRGQFVKFNKENGAWLDMPVDDAVTLVREKFEKEVSKRQDEIDAAIIRLPLEKKIMDKEQLKAYKKFSLEQRSRFRQLCQLDIDDVMEAVALIDIPPWIGRSPIAALPIVAGMQVQNENERDTKRRKESRETSRLAPGSEDAHDTNHSSSFPLFVESNTWVDTLMMATQTSLEQLLTSSTTFNEDSPSPDPYSHLGALWGDDTGFSGSDGPFLPEIDDIDCSFS